MNGRLLTGLAAGGFAAAAAVAVVSWLSTRRARQQADAAAGGAYRREWLYQWLWGPGWTCPGGEALTAELLQRLGLRIPAKSPMQVLEVGTGTGGGAFWLADRYGAQVTAIDTQPDMIEAAQQKCIRMFQADPRNLPRFQARPPPSRAEPRMQVQDPLSLAQQPVGQRFDLVWCREGLLHYSDSDKRQVLGQLVRLVKPGGVCCVIEYCRRQGPLSGTSTTFQHFVQAQGYDLYSGSELKTALEAAAPESSVQLLDVSDDLIEQFAMDAETLQERRDEFVGLFGEPAWESLRVEITSRLFWLRRGDLTLGQFIVR